jgi:hypothetical protein
MNMKTLNITTGNFDQLNTFQVNAGKRVMKCSLMLDYEKVGDGVLWAMSSGSTLKASYTDADRAESERLASETPLENGELVTINGEQYKVRVLGAFSDTAIFDKV